MREDLGGKPPTTGLRGDSLWGRETNQKKTTEPQHFRAEDTACAKAWRVESAQPIQGTGQWLEWSAEGSDSSLRAWGTR